MTIDKFRIMHSALIEHYQFIEFHLEGIYALLCKKKFPEGLVDVEKSNIKYLVKQIQKLESEKQISIFSKTDYDKIENARIRRNFWCHNCYVDIVFDRKTEVPKKSEDIQTLIKDTSEAEQLRNILFQKIQIYIAEYHDKHQEFCSL